MLLGYKRIAVLQYNSVGDYPEPFMLRGIPEETLTEQMDYLAANGYR